MNILLLTSTIKEPDDSDKTVTNVVLFFAKSWVEQGHTVVLIHNESKFPLVYYLLPRFIYKAISKHSNTVIPSLSSRKRLIRKEDGVLIARIPISKVIPHSRFTKREYKKQMTKIVDFLKQIRFVPDVVTGHWEEPQLNLVYRLSLHYHSYSALVFHGNIPKHFSNKDYEMLESLSCIFFRNRYTLQKEIDIHSDKNFLRNKSSVCYSGIPSEYVYDMTTRDLKMSPFRVCYVGRLVDYKKVDAILFALLKAFPNKEFEFFIVGSGPSEKELMKIVHDNAIEKNVFFLGNVSRKEAKIVMRQSDCFSMISINEVFGLVYLEAMSQGCITIASKNGGIDGIIVDGKNGFLCNQGDSDNLSRIFTKIKKMGGFAIETIQKNAFSTVQDYTDSATAKRYLDDICRKE